MGLSRILIRWVNAERAEPRKKLSSDRREPCLRRRYLFLLPPEEKLGLLKFSEIYGEIDSAGRRIARLRIVCIRAKPALI